MLVCLGLPSLGGVTSPVVVGAGVGGTLGASLANLVSRASLIGSTFDEDAGMLSPSAAAASSGDALSLKWSSAISDKSGQADGKNLVSPTNFVQLFWNHKDRKKQEDEK